MNEQVQIKNINLQIGDQDISISIENAKKLQAVLNELFKATPAPYVTRPFVPSNPPLSWPVVPNTQPIWNPNPEWKKWEITCSSNNDSLNVKM